MKEQIHALLQQALNVIAKEQGLSLPEGAQFNIERPRDASHGDFSSNIAMVFCKVFKMPPRGLAERIISLIPQHPGIAEVSIAGPGFINIVLNQDLFKEKLENMWQSIDCGVEVIDHKQTVVVDYSSPNLAKEMHVGHLRSTIIGDAIARVLELKGYQVIRQNHVGDWGTQFGMLIAHFDDESRAHPEEVMLNDLETFYKAAKLRFDSEPAFAERARNLVVALQSGDPKCLEMWKAFIDLSIDHCQEVYERLGVALKPSDVRAESAYNDDLPLIVTFLKEKGLLIEHDGAQCVFMEEFKGKDDELLPVIVQKKDGGFLYASTDLAAIRFRHEALHANRVLYVVDARQSLHFQQVFALAKLAGFADETMQLEHISFGMVLDKSGRPYKSRDGGVTKLADLLDESERRARKLIESKQTQHFSEQELANMANIIGISSVKYADLSKHRTSDYVFDWDTMISFDGNTAPYLLYAFTRIQSIFQKTQMAEQDLKTGFILESHHDEDLAKQLLLFPEVVDAVCVKATPHLLCTYLYELAGTFSSFYEACPILNQEEPLRTSRLKLVALTARILKKGLGLLGITTLTRM
ncbi:MAG TPA: arginine--tRNA ligase [Legionellales bacterium]|nr:arginine--tRNA ligase [Legionellales bacterium]